MINKAKLEGVVMRISFLAILMLAVGCGGSGSVNVDADEDNVCGEIAEVACHNLYQCCAEGEIEDFLGVSEPRTELQCRDDIEVICERRAGTLAFSIQEGRVRFDKELMNTCLDALVAPDNTCVSVVSKLPWVDACMNSAWIGTVAVDQTCLFAHDCAGGADAFCAPNQKCKMLPTAGFPCAAGACASQFFCMTGVCAPRVAAGAMCTSTAQCQKDLFCDTTVSPAVCAAKAPGGAACTSDFGCQSNDCIPGQCMGTTQTCFTDTQCGSRCANNPNRSCATSANCGAGNCQTAGTCCGLECPINPTVFQNCPTGDTCVFPVQCLPGDCIGDPVCTVATFDVDWCTDPLSQLPLF